MVHIRTQYWLSSPNEQLIEIAAHDVGAKNLSFVQGGLGSVRCQCVSSSAVPSPDVCGAEKPRLLPLLSLVVSMH